MKVKFLNCSIKKKYDGFSLLELLVVIAIIGIVLSFIVPNVINRPSEARKLKITNDINVLESALELGISFDIAPKLSIEDGIEAVRKDLPKCYFDKNKTYQGVEALKAYKKKWDDKNQCSKNRPIHNFASHPADAFRYGCTFVGGKMTNWKEQIDINTSYIV